MKKAEIIKSIEESKVISIIRAQHTTHILGAVQAIWEAGFPIVEITSNTPEYLELIKNIRTHLPNVIIGAGTITSASLAGEAISAGAMFLVTPVTCKEVLEYASFKEVPVVMGAFTPTEIHNALKWGADFIKLFPASHLGPEYLKAVKAPLGEVRFVPTGGVTKSNLKDWLDAGATAFGLGSSLLKGQLLEDGKLDEIKLNAQSFKVELDKYRQ